MIIVYTPEGCEPQHYDARSLKVSEASIVQRTVDMKWQEILKGLEEDDLDAMRGIVWVLKKRDNPSLRWADFDPGVGEMTSAMDRQEVAAYIDSFVAVNVGDSDITPEVMRQILTSRLPAISVDPEHTRTLIDEKTQGPKGEGPAEDNAPPQEESAQAADPSPSLTSTGPEPSSSASSPTSSTSLPQESTA